VVHGGGGVALEEIYVIEKRVSQMHPLQIHQSADPDPRHQPVFTVEVRNNLRSV